MREKSEAAGGGAGVLFATAMLFERFETFGGDLPALLPRLLARVKLLEAGSPQSDDPLPSS